MQRHSVVAEIFGYLVCLIAVLVFFASVAGIVNGAFGIGNPAAHPRIMIRAMAMRPGTPGRTFYWRGQAAGPADSKAFPIPPNFNPAALRARASGDARYEAVRRLVLSLVMLGVSIFVFRRSFDWVTRTTP